MGEIDNYLHAQVAPALQQGEQIMGMGLLRRPYRFNALGVPSHYEEWLATATNLRLILFKTEGSGLFNVLKVKPKPMCAERREWWFQELQSATTGKVLGVGSGITISLNPHQPLGPYEGESRRYDLFPEVEGLDAHGTFYGQFTGWLQQQVAAGSFPMDEARRQRVAAYQEQQRQEAERKRLAAEQRARKVKGFFGAWRSWLPPTIAVALFLTAAGLAIAAVDYFGSASRADDRLTEIAKEVDEGKACRRAKPKSSDCTSESREKDLSLQASSERDYRDDQVLWGGIMSASSVVGLIAAILVGVIWLVRRRKHAASAAP